MSVISIDLSHKRMEQAHLVKACEQAFDDRMESVANRIADRSDFKILGLTGPSCAGKTTAAKKLTEALEKRGRCVHTVSVDDFYFDKEYLHARANVAEGMEIDYDSEDTIDTALLLQKTQSLLAQKPTTLPCFDFQTGERTEGRTVTPKADDVFLFEGIQILYPKVRKILSSAAYCSVYIAPSSAICCNGLLFEPNRIRLMRRLVRDYRYRASAPSFTFYLWESVRKNEEACIFPYAHTCDEQIDSTMPYEIGMLKPYLEELLLQMSPTDTYAPQARELLQDLQKIPVVPSELLGEKSLYKEFI